MSRKRSREDMEGFRQAFVAGAQEKHGVTAQGASAIFDKLAGFSDFGFPKSHAYAFAVLAYQSVWLRHYYPAEYNAALLNNQPMGFYEPNVIINDARRHGIQVLRPSINRSEVRSKPGKGHILLGLDAIRDMSTELAKLIVAEREQHGPYASLADLLRRTFPPRRVVEHLIAVGALGEFGLSRRELLWQLGLLLPFDASAPSVRVSRRNPQPPLGLSSEADMVRLPDMDEWERMVADFGLLRLSPSYHPVALLRSELPPDVLSAKAVREAGNGAHVRTAGMVVCRQRPGTAKGIVFLLLEDETGLTNVVVRPDLYEAARSVVRTEAYVCVEGLVELRSDSLNVLAESIVPLAATLQPPRIVLRQKDPGGRPDPREAASGSPDLHQVLPHSHDFH
jgi:error-prone DNA polymerase